MALDAHRHEVHDLKGALDTLRKEIDDRQMLIESQHEKIGDMTRELHNLRQTTQRGYLERVSNYFFEKKNI